MDLATLPENQPLLLHSDYSAGIAAWGKGPTCPEAGFWGVNGPISSLPLSSPNALQLPYSQSLGTCSGGMKGTLQCCLLCGVSSVGWARGCTGVILCRRAGNHLKALFMIAFQTLSEALWNLSDCWIPSEPSMVLSSSACVCDFSQV